MVKGQIADKNGATLKKKLFIFIIAWFVSYLYLNVVYVLGLKELGIVTLPMFIGLYFTLNKRLRNEMLSFEFFLNEIRNNKIFRIGAIGVSFGCLLMLTSIFLRIKTCN